MSIQTVKYISFRQQNRWRNQGSFNLHLELNHRVLSIDRRLHTCSLQLYQRTRRLAAACKLSLP